MSDKSRQTKQLKRNQTPKTGSSSARERARAEAALAARKKRDRNIIIGIAVAVVLIVGGSIGGYLAYQQFGGPSVNTEVAGPEQVIGELSGADPIVYGDEAAPNTMDVYLDFSCPHCKAFEEEQASTVQELIDSGEYKVAYHPLSFMVRPGASVNAANAFACSAQRGFGQAYMAQLFANQGLNWSDNQLVSLAEQVGGDAAGDVSGCITRKQNGDWVDAVNNAEKPADFTGTPALYVGGTQVEWFEGQTPEQFTEAVRTATAA